MTDPDWAKLGSTVELTREQLKEVWKAEASSNGFGGVSSTAASKTPLPHASGSGEQGEEGDFNPASSVISCLKPNSSKVPSPSGDAQMFNGAHSFHIDTAHLAGRDVHIYYPKADPDPGYAREVIEIASWLSPKNYRVHHDTTVALRAENTGLWFLTSEEFKAWVKGEPGVLWVTGMPGSGKTILASQSIDYLSPLQGSQTRTGLAYIYCRYTEQCSSRDILCTFLRQLVETHELARDEIRPVFSKNQRYQRALTAQEAASLLFGFTHRLRRIFLIIDGLDEIADKEKSEILARLQEIPVHLLIFSRPMDLFQELLPRSRTVQIEARKRDIETFVLHRIDTSAHLRKVLQHRHDIILHMRERIQHKSRGMFLVAALQMEALSVVPTESLVSALDALPSGVDDMYALTLKRIDAQPAEHATLGRSTLTLLKHAKQALSVAAAQQALRTLGRHAADDGEREIPEEIILSTCCGLVTKSSGELQLVPYTILFHHTGRKGKGKSKAQKEVLEKAREAARVKRVREATGRV
ncbi:hypothetical protein NMY22_g19181 [Coprinellus aureogranulatus]|nr:hypothetical protein NMY22_g19181 [Coprinellus aureogranulatus]